LGRIAASTASLVVALLVFQPVIASAEDAPPEAEVPDAAEDTAEAAVDSADAASAGATAQDVVEGLVAAPGGIPAEPMDPASAVDTVQAAMTNVQNDSSGIDEAYVIQFGDTFDWVQLTSGEWIKGNIKRMRDDTMEFDSDDLGMLYIDFGDIALVHSPQANTYVFDDRVSATGSAVVTEDVIICQTDEGTKTFPRSELESIVEGERERDWWSMKLRFGLQLNRGNTNQMTYNIDFNTKREDRLTLLDLNYNGTFGSTDGEQIVKRHLGEGLFNVFLGGRWWVTPLFGQLFNDTFQSIKFRATPAAGAGVHLVDKPNVKWDFQTGLGYQFLRFTSDVDPTLENPQGDLFIPLFTYWDFDITGDIGLTMSWLTNLVVTSIGNTNHTGKADLAVSLTSVLDLNVAFLFLRTEDPAQSAPADPPAPQVQKNEYQLVVGISLVLG